MSKLTNIKHKILQLEGGAFQEFCDAYLFKKGYGNITEFGMKSGTMKTTIGHPDTYFVNESTNKYIFVGYTTQQTQINKKVEEDILDCLDPTKTGVDPKDIEQIICCHTSSTLSAGKHMELIELCEKQGILLTIFGIDHIANDIYHNYGILAKDFLNESIDTGQIMDQDDFVTAYDHSTYSSPLNNEFYLRENEFQQLKTNIETSKVSVVSGQSGVGKTRLALEVCNSFSIDNGYKFFVIRNKNLPIFEDLVAYIGKPGKYLLMIDDANQLAEIKHILEYILKEKYEVKIVVTVRDYAKEGVIQEIEEFTKPSELNLIRFTDDEIKELMQEQFKIYNEEYLDKIILIAEGNARLAFMAGKVALETQSLKTISDASQLYEVFFSKVFKDNMFNRDYQLLKSLGILACLDTVKLSELDRLDVLLSNADLSIEEFKESLYKLHEIETLDIYHSELVKISDQSLSNYAIYYVFYQKQIISIEKLIKEIYIDNSDFILKVINILLSVFGSEKVHAFIQQNVKAAWSYFEQKGEFPGEFVYHFHGAEPVKSLLYVKNKINKGKEVSRDLKEVDFEKNIYGGNSILKILSRYTDTDYISEALELIFLYVNKNQEVIEEGVKVLRGHYSVLLESYKFDYLTQQKLAATFEENYKKTSVNKLIFSALSKNLLKTFFEETRATRGNVTFYRFPLQISNGAIAYRNKIWKIIIANYEKFDDEFFIELFNEYGSYDDSVEKDIYIYEMNMVDELISLIGKDRISVAVLCVRELNSIYHFFEIELSPYLNSFMNTLEWKVLDTFFMVGYYRDYEDETEREDAIKADYIQLIDLITPDKYKWLVKLCGNFSKIDNVNWEINQGLERFICFLRRQRENYMIFIDTYIDSNDQPKLRIQPSQIIKECIDKFGIEWTYTRVSNKRFINRNEWEYMFYVLLPQESINEKWCDRLEAFLKCKNDKELVQSGVRDIAFLKKYNAYKPGFFLRAVKLIYHKYEYSPFIANLYFTSLMYNRTEKGAVEKAELFIDDIPLLKKIYFKFLTHDRDRDYDGKLLIAIARYDESIIIDYFEHLLAKDRYYNNHADNIDYIWKLDSYKIWINKFIDLLYDKGSHFYFNTEKIGQMIFINSDKEDDKLYARKETLLLDYIKNNINNESKIIYIFNVISELSKSTRSRCIKHLAKLDVDFSIFKNIRFEPSSWGGWTGSLIPQLQTKIDFLHDLLPHFTGIQFIEHRAKIEQMIENYKGNIIQEELDEIRSKNIR